MKDISYIIDVRYNNRYERNDQSVLNEFEHANNYYINKSKSEESKI